MLGRLIISNKKNNAMKYFENPIKSKQIILGTDFDYLLHRLSKYVFEASETENTLPLTVNADFTNSILFDKGCYVGQEVNARANFTGVIRRRMCVFIVTKEQIKDFRPNIKDNIDLLSKYIKKDFDQDLQGSVVKNKEGFKIFAVMKNYGNMAVGMFKLDFQEPDNFEHDGLYYYRLKFQPFEKFVQDKSK